MRRLPVLLALAAVLFVRPVADLGAQDQPLIPRPIDPAASPAQRARAVAELVLAGDQGKLEACLRKHAAPADAAGGQ